MENTEQVDGGKPQISARVDTSVWAVIERIRQEENRTMSNMVESLLKTHPRIVEALASESAIAA